MKEREPDRRTGPGLKPVRPHGDGGRDLRAPPKIYAGIGSRSTPEDILELMELIGYKLADEWILRSGGAQGADSAFERGCDAYTKYNGGLALGEKEIFRSGDAKPWSLGEAEKHIPANRPPFNTWNLYVRGLIARNMMQVLGSNGDKPVTFVVCWTMANVKDGGGTGYAIRCAQAHDIPVYNLQEVGMHERFLDAVGE